MKVCPLVLKSHICTQLYNIIFTASLSIDLAVPFWESIPPLAHFNRTFSPLKQWAALRLHLWTGEVSLWFLGVVHGWLALRASKWGCHSNFCISTVRSYGTQWRAKVVRNPLIEPHNARHAWATPENHKASSPPEELSLLSGHCYNRLNVLFKWATSGLDRLMGSANRKVATAKIVCDFYYGRGCPLTSRLA